MDQTEKRELENQCMMMGLARLNDANLIPQIAMLIRDHETLGEMLRACLPDKRVEMFEAIRPHLNFYPLPLDKYLTFEMAQKTITHETVKKGTEN